MTLPAITSSGERAGGISTCCRQRLTHTKLRCDLAALLLPASRLVRVTGVPPTMEPEKTFSAVMRLFVEVTPKNIGGGNFVPVSFILHTVMHLRNIVRVHSTADTGCLAQYLQKLFETPDEKEYAKIFATALKVDPDCIDIKDRVVVRFWLALCISGAEHCTSWCGCIACAAAFGVLAVMYPRLCYRSVVPRRREGLHGRRSRGRASVPVLCSYSELQSYVRLEVLSFFLCCLFFQHRHRST